MIKEGDCINCGANLVGNFCHNCGLKKIEPQDKNIGLFIEELFASLTMADGRILKTFKRLFFQPGELSKLFILGNRKKYWTPLQLFFFANLIYFLFPNMNTFNSSLQVQVSNQFYSEMIKPMVEHQLDKNTNFEENYNSSTASNSKLLLIVLVVFFALFMQLLFLGNKQYYFIDFLATSGYFTSFYILTFLVVIPFMVSSISPLFGYDSFYLLNDKFYTPLLFLANGFYLYFILKRAYGSKTLSAILRALILILSMIPLFIIYRLILFFVTYWTVV